MCVGVGVGVCVCVCVCVYVCVFVQGVGVGCVVGDGGEECRIKPTETSVGRGIVYAFN